MAARRILVVGSSGLIGSAVAGEYVRRGASVVGTQRSSGGQRCAASGQEAIQVDLSRPETFESIAGEFDAVFMCSGMTSIARCEDAPKETSLVNVTNTLQLLHRLSRQSARIVFLSSSTVFGPDAAVHKEDSAIGNPRYEYGRQKATVESALIARNSGASVVRITKVLSKTLPLMEKFASELANNQVCRPFANLLMSPVSLRYVVDALVEVEESGHGGIFHFSGAAMSSYADFLRAYALHQGYSTDNVLEAVMSNEAIPSPMESKAYAFLDMDRTTALLNIFPQSLDSVLADL